MDTDLTTVEAYLAPLPEDVRATLEDLRRVILSEVPEATESISYGMPTFKYRGKPLIYFGAAKHHCAIYGTSAGTTRFTPKEPLAEDYVRGLLREKIEAIDTAIAARRKRPRGASPNA